LENNPDHYGIFLETAHPIKFRDTVEETLGLTLDIPTQIQHILDKKPEKTSLSGYEAFKEYLLSQAV
jgi:threonine synthase